MSYSFPHSFPHAAFIKRIGALKQLDIIGACEPQWVHWNEESTNFTVNYEVLGQNKKTTIRRDGEPIPAVYERAYCSITRKIQDMLAPGVYPCVKKLLKLIDADRLKAISFRVGSPDSRTRAKRMEFRYGGVTFSILADGALEAPILEIYRKLWEQAGRIIDNLDKTSIRQMIGSFGISYMSFTEIYIQDRTSPARQPTYQTHTSITFCHRTSSGTVYTVRGSTTESAIMSLVEKMLCDLGTRLVPGSVPEPKKEPVPETKKEPVPETKKEPVPETKKEPVPETKKEPEPIAETSDPNVIRLMFTLPISKNPRVYIRGALGLDVADGIYRLIGKLPQTMIPTRRDDGIWQLEGIDELPIKVEIPFSVSDDATMWLGHAFAFGELEKTDASFICIIRDIKYLDQTHMFMKFYKAVTAKMI